MALNGSARFDENDPAWTIPPFELHLPVFSVVDESAEAISTPKPLIYGTAFPIASGVLATAAHVVEAAKRDGRVAVSVVRGAREEFRYHEVTELEVVREIDFALLRCPGLASLHSLPIDFDNHLGMLMPASAVGFPLAVDAEYVICVARGFGGYVVTRRELYHLSGQPPGYEVSFFAPQGLSGAPLISTVFGAPRCYGYMIQQSTIGVGDEHTPVGIAVGIEALLSVKSQILNGPLAHIFGRDQTPYGTPSPMRLPGGLLVPEATSDRGWPD